MIKSIIIYNKISGEIKGKITCSENLVDIQTKEGDDYIESSDDIYLKYIDTLTKSLINKVELPVTINKTTMLSDGVDTIVISNLPIPSTVDVPDVGVYKIDDKTNGDTDDFEFTIDTPGEYHIKCSAFPYLDKEFTINAS